VTRAARALAAVAAVLCGPAAAGALEDCTQLAPTRPQITPCLNAHKKAATDAMLEQYLAVEQALAEVERATGRGGKAAVLKQSQRDFERYLHAHCQLPLQLFDSGSGAGQAQLACEVDLLRQRAELLKLLAGPSKD